MGTEAKKDWIRANMGLALFSSCDFLMGQNQSVVIVIPAYLPRAETYTVSVTDKNIRFKAGYDDIAEMEYQGGEVFRRIANNTVIGLVENPSQGKTPTSITNVAYVEVRRSLS